MHLSIHNSSAGCSGETRTHDILNMNQLSYLCSTLRYFKSGDGIPYPHLLALAHSLCPSSVIITTQTWCCTTPLGAANGNRTRTACLEGRNTRHYTTATYIYPWMIYLSGLSRWVRTIDSRLKRAILYQLSYREMFSPSYFLPLYKTK